METSKALNSSSASDLTIIGIGSSAGGLEAISELVGSLPADMNATYVVVQHLSPHHKSLMTELVARQTTLEVENITDGLKPRPNVVYITPPKNDVVVQNGLLRLVEPNPETATPKPSVDRFLLSLAEEMGDRSVAIILSGTGPDGAYGVQAIREACGITIAQDSESAKYDGMPSAATRTGCVDLVLRPRDIGKHLEKILAQPRNLEGLRNIDVEPTPLSDLLQILMVRTKVDFREYKQSTVTRRIERRMVALGIESQEEYTSFCRSNPQALDALFKDLLISVTRFFRDKQEFEQFEAHLPALLEAKGDAPLRVWVAGCATGEEVYSIAILLAEALGGAVGPAKTPEIGVLDVQLTEEGANGVFLDDLPDRFKSLQWHSAEVSRLPEGAAVLATSPACAVQAMSWSNTAYSVQFHLELEDNTVDDWAAIPAYANALKGALGDAGVEVLRQDCAANMADFAKMAERVYMNWLQTAAKA